ncbi:hypothetical protein N431DRAFT_492923 [Stipitochalara longipes BDJ]|nr:hypothetical protein N431DRAFT_492923 [Stipitochalara longipes BDJ]
MQYVRICAAFMIIFSHIAYVEALQNVCFGRTDVQNTEFFACQPDATESSCCLAGDIRYSNGLCAPGPTESVGLTPFFAHGCTDANFTTPICVPNCIPSNGAGLQLCPSYGPDHFCCYGLNGCNCSDSSQVFSLSTGTVVTTIDPSATYTATPTTSTSLTTSSNAPVSPSTSQSTILSPTISSSTSSSSGIPATTSKKSSNGLGIGIGVGVGLLIAITLAAVGFYFLRRGKSSPKDAQLAMENRGLPILYKDYDPQETRHELGTCLEKVAPPKHYFRFPDHSYQGNSSPEIIRVDLTKAL